MVQLYAGTEDIGYEHKVVIHTLFFCLRILFAFLMLLMPNVFYQTKQIEMSSRAERHDGYICPPHSFRECNGEFQVVQVRQTCKQM